MSSETATTVRMFGTLQSYRKEHGLPSETEVSIPTGGCAARVLACELELPLDEVKAVSVNHQIYNLDHFIEPGDQVAFIPVGSPHAACDQSAESRARNETN